MKYDLREYKPFIYIIILAVSAIFLIISANDLIFGDTYLAKNFVTLSSIGAWEYWVFTASFIFTVAFGYLVFVIFRDTRKFYDIIDRGTKQAFLKNYKELQQIAKKLGPKLEESLSEATKKWKVK
ncbi:MAG: DUF3198 domain-containing protein [Candidatus Thermoplasmatota archaeon]|nr:DUF3198 domain-containing protein [Candidatus Thermoplasmatota archaeon]